MPSGAYAGRGAVVAGAAGTESFGRAASRPDAAGWGGVPVNFK